MTTHSSPNCTNRVAGLRVGFAQRLESVVPVGARQGMVSEKTGTIRSGPVILVRGSASGQSTIRTPSVRR